MGLLTKIDPVDVKYGIGKAEHDTEGRVITAEYDHFFLVVSYIPNSGRKLVRLTYRQEFNEAFRAYLNELDKKKPVIWYDALPRAQSDATSSSLQVRRSECRASEHRPGQRQIELEDGRLHARRARRLCQTARRRLHRCM